MITIELSQEDAAMLIRSLEYLLSETRYEIADTDSQFFRDGVKEEKAVLERALSQLQMAAKV